MSDQNSVGSMSVAIGEAKESALSAIKNTADLAGLRALSADLNKKTAH